ncbi:GGDEF domain-containing protein [Proteobacteria bacterium 005FR1]|nr:GGDEF domain-containing protein [Proteobacteria bacterium 005FR1]
MLRLPRRLQCRSVTPRLLLLILTSSWLTLVSAANAAVPGLDAGSHYDSPVGQYLSYFQESEGAISPSEALKGWQEGRFRLSGEAIPSFGIGAPPVWLAFTVFNRQELAVRREIAVHIGWIDQVEAYFFAEGTEIARQLSGDRIAVRARPIADNIHRLRHEFTPGQTLVLLRVATPDPMVVPLFFADFDAIQQRQQSENYFYGFVYGAIVVLLLYNFLIYLRLQLSRYLFYTGYLVSFLAMNLSYTGHGMLWFWPDATNWQAWAPPIFMVAFACSGLAFALKFLDIRERFPKLRRTVVGGCLLVIAIEVVAIVTGKQSLALVAAFSFVLVFSTEMLLLGLISLWLRNPVAPYFIAGSVSAVLGALITALTVWGALPFTFLGFRAVDIGMVLDAVFLALALAELFRKNQQARQEAELASKMDLLTRVYNRRGFYENVKPLWNSALQWQEDVAVAIVDIDSFKQINDTFGHKAGDDALSEVAARLSALKREKDVLSRWGGEEFILFMPATTVAEAMSLGEHCRKVIAEATFVVDGSTFPLTISIGICHSRSRSMRLDDLLMAADQQLYRAKHMGRNAVRGSSFAPRSDSESEAHSELEYTEADKAQHEAQWL